MTILNIDKSTTYGLLETESGDTLVTESLVTLITEQGSQDLTATNQTKNLAT